MKNLFVKVQPNLEFIGEKKKKKQICSTQIDHSLWSNGHTPVPWMVRQHPSPRRHPWPDPNRPFLTQLPLNPLGHPLFRHTDTPHSSLPYPLPMLSCLSATWAPYLYIQAASLFQEFPCDITTSKTSNFSGSKCSLHVDGCISCKFLVQFISVCHILVMSYHHSNNWSLGLLVKKLSPSLAVQIT